MHRKLEQGNTFVCHIVNDVDVITANKCPVREILKARRGCRLADLGTATLCPSTDIESESWWYDSCSTGSMAGVFGVGGGENAGSGSKDSSGRAFAVALMVLSVFDL